MGVRITVNGKEMIAEDYRLSEESTPTASDDSSGSVGEITFTVLGVDQPFLLEGKDVTLTDTRRGVTIGKVTQASEVDRGKTSVSCLTRLGRLNAYGVQAQPFSGTLRNAFAMYAGLADQVVDVLVDDSIANRNVVFPGWYGELWYNLKLMAAAQRCEITLVSGVILLRPLRTRQVIQHRDISRNRTYGGSTLAQAVEVYFYNNKVIENKLVYPPGGWKPETEVLTVGAGETVSHRLELSASVSYIKEPTMLRFVNQKHDSTSVYTIVGDDGLPIVPEQWRANGGRVTVRINKDTTSLTLRIRGAEGIMGINNKLISNYSIALGSDTTGNRYSTLRIVGNGVAFNKEKIRVATGLSEKVTGTEIGITIGKAFVTARDGAWRAGAGSARRYAVAMGRSPRLTSWVTLDR